MPNRLIRESIRTSRSINALSDFDFRIWAYLITYVDDYGRGSADPELLKGIVFTRRKGVTEQQIRTALDDLANTGMITLYEVDGESFFCFPNWDKYQTIRAKKSKFPAPENICMQMNADENICPRNPIQSESNPESRIQNPESEIESKETTSTTTRAQTPSPTDPDVAAVLADFATRIYATPSPICIGEMSGYAKSLGVELCKMAFDKALDEQVTKWAYIKAILQDWTDNGLKTVADVQRHEAKRAEKKAAKKSGKYEYDYGDKGWSL